MIFHEYIDYYKMQIENKIYYPIANVKLCIKYIEFKLILKL